MPTPRALVFDLDGCLVHTRPAIEAAVNRLRAEEGLSALSPGAIEALLGVPLPAFLGRALGIPELEAPQETTARYGSVYRATLRRALPYPAVREVLLGLEERGIGKAVCTNKTTALAIATLHAVGLDSFFDRVKVLGCDAVANPKPHPEALLLLAKRFGIRPSNMWMVGDSAGDIQVARAAGSVAVGCLYGYGDPQIEGPDAVIAEPYGLLDLIDRNWVQ